MRFKDFLISEATQTFIKDLPKKFKSGEDFMDFVYAKWPSRETYVEHQGGGAWLADIVGDDRIKGATYDEHNHYVSWTDEEGEELDEGLEHYKGRALIDKFLDYQSRIVVSRPKLSRMAKTLTKLVFEIDPKQAQDCFDNVGYDPKKLGKLNGHELADAILEMYNFFGGSRKFMRVMNDEIKKVLE